MRPHALPTLLAAAALTALTACGQPSIAATPQPDPSPAVSDWPHQQTLTDWAERVETLGQRHPGSYAGVEIDLPGNALIVHRTPSTALDTAVRRLVPASITLRLADAAHTQRQLADLTTDVNSDATYWQRRGITLNSVGPRIGTCVVIGIEDPQRHTGTITARYPNQPICVEHAGPSEPLTAGS